jgi:hypothetical protein
MHSSGFLLDCLHAAAEELADHAAAVESAHREAGQAEFLILGPLWVEQWRTLGWWSTPAPARPVQPTEGSGLSIAHERERAEPWPLVAPSHEAFFHPVAEHVADLL